MNVTETKGIPVVLEPLMCNCSQPEKVGYSTLYPDAQHWITQMYALGMTIDQRMLRATPIGQFCANCLKPVGYTILGAARICDGCERYYVPKPVPESYPIKYFLCEKCDVAPRSRR